MGSFFTKDATVEAALTTKQLVVVPTTQAVSSGTLSLDASSATQQIFTGNTYGQIIALPDATTLINGYIFVLWSESSQPIRIQNNAGTFLLNLTTNNKVIITLTDNSTAEGDWSHVMIPEYKYVTNEPTGFLNRLDSTVSFDNASREFRIGTADSKYSYWCSGDEYVEDGTRSVQIADTNGHWYFYYDQTDLVATQTSWDFSSGQAFIAYNYWDTSSQRAIVFGEERHGIVMDWATHERLHEIDGMKIVPGSFDSTFIADGDGSLDAHAQFSMEGGEVHDEDIDFNIFDSTAPVRPFEQKLDEAWIPVYYKDGTDGDWRKMDASAFPMVFNPGSLCQYNHYDGTTWSLQDATNGYHITTWIAVTNNRYEPVIGVLGRVQSESLIQSISENLEKDITEDPDFIFLERDFLYRVIYKTDTAFTNQPQAAIQAITDLLITESPDRYTFTAVYTGNAVINKYLDIFGGISSNKAPFTFPEQSYIRTVTISAAASSTGSIGFFYVADLVNPIFTISLAAETYKRFNVTYRFQSDDQIALRMVSGNINKPAVRVWVQTLLG